MKELSIEEKAKAYDEAIERAEGLIDFCSDSELITLEYVFHELKESEDERIINFLIKQANSVLDSMTDDDEEVPAWKLALSWLEKQGEQKLADKVEPKFKVKYAGSEYNVFDIKDIAGVIFYGIEDEPNHIDYVQAENCEIVSGYGVKEKGSPYPTKSAMFSEHNPAWSEEDNIILSKIIADYERSNEEWFNAQKSLPHGRKITWLKSLKDRYTWKPSNEQMNALLWIIENTTKSVDVNVSLNLLYEQLKTL